MSELLRHYLRTRGFPTPPKPARAITARSRGSIADQQTRYTYGDDNRPLQKAMTKAEDGKTTTVALHYDDQGHPTRLTIDHEGQLIKELTIQVTPTEIRESGKHHQTVFTYDPDTNRLTEIETFTSDDLPPLTSINHHDFKADNSRVVTSTDIEGRTPASFETHDPNNINTGRISGALHTHTHIHERDQHGFPTKATHIAKNEIRTTVHEVTWQVDYRE